MIFCFFVLQLGAQLPKDASIGVMFCCMLYLANEQNLTLDGMDDLSDIKIVRQDEGEQIHVVNPNA